jgi:hypothetical protein
MSMGGWHTISDRMEIPLRAADHGEQPHHARPPPSPVLPHHHPHHPIPERVILRAVQARLFQSALSIGRRHHGALLRQQFFEFIHDADGDFAGSFFIHGSHPIPSA